MPGQTYQDQGITYTYNVNGFLWLPPDLTIPFDPNKYMRIPVPHVTGYAWKVIPFAALEYDRAWTQVRAKRNELLDDLQWRYERYARQTRLNATPTDDITKLDTYAQALADIPQTQADPLNIIWPILD